MFNLWSLHPSLAPQLLLAARADFQRAGPGRMAALAGAAAWASAETVKAILDAGPLGKPREGAEDRD
eukprot:Skav216652  [mRNA]  locus=scaffold1255:318233:318433:+ [translate_table: standard]